MFTDFKLVNDKENLYAIVVINGKTYEKDVTKYFKEANGHDDWLDYRLFEMPNGALNFKEKKEEGINEKV